MVYGKVAFSLRYVPIAIHGARYTLLRDRALIPELGIPVVNSGPGSESGHAIRIEESNRYLAISDQFLLRFITDLSQKHLILHKRLVPCIAIGTYLNEYATLQKIYFGKLYGG